VYPVASDARAEAGFRAREIEIADTLTKALSAP
jgi:hypothetical protein